MDHDRWREAISSRLDGEDAGVPTAVLERHLADCADCRAFESEVARLGRVTRISPVGDVPDRTHDLLAEMTPRHGGRRLEWARALLAGLAVVELGAAVTAFTGGNGGAVPFHLSRELGVVLLALAAGLALAAARPALALGLLPLFTVLAVGFVLIAVADIGSGRTTLLAESRHLLEVGAVAALWWLLRPRPALRRAAA